MRFILNFIFFGLLFYAIWFFFPEVFQSLLNGVQAVFTYIKDFVTAMGERINPPKETPPPETSPAPALMPFLVLGLTAGRRYLEKLFSV